MRRIRLTALALAIPVLATACGSMEMRDTTAAVDADPLCASQPSQPNEPTSVRCQRRTEVKYQRKDEPLDLRGESREGKPR